jgi:hypothetical protein
MIIGHKHITEAMDFEFIRSGRGAFQWHRRQIVRFSGATGKEYVGISNDNAGEKPAHR